MQRHRVARWTKLVWWWTNQRARRRGCVKRGTLYQGAGVEVQHEAEVIGSGHLRKVAS
jgi:hypothetical protein